MNARSPEPGASSAPLIETMLLQVTAGRDALSIGQRLDTYTIERVIGRDDLCIRYASRDPVSGEPVEIEEYLPEAIARREDDGTVEPRSSTLLAAYQAGMRAFLEEALQLAHSVHPSLLRMLRSWDGGGTAYRARPALSGHTLAEVRRAMGAPPDEAWLRSLLRGLAGALRALHASWLVHGNVRPGNILIRPDGSPLLLGFESARWTLADRLPHPEPGFVALEQLEPSRGRQQGPWSDVYALGALVVYCVTGRAPTPAPERAGAPLAAPFANALADLWRAGTQVSYSPSMLFAVDAALAVAPGQRMRSIDEFLVALDAPVQAPTPEALVKAAVAPKAPPSAALPAALAASRPPEAKPPPPAVAPTLPSAAESPLASKPVPSAAATAPLASGAAPVRSGEGPLPESPAGADEIPQRDEVPTFFADIPVRYPMPPLPASPTVSAPAPPVAQSPVVRVPVSLPAEPELHTVQHAAAAALGASAGSDAAAPGPDDAWRAVRPGEAPRAEPPATPRRRSSRAWWLVAAVPLAGVIGLGWHWEKVWRTEQAIDAYGKGAVEQSRAGPGPVVPPERSDAVARADAALAAAAQRVAPPPVPATRDGLPLPAPPAGVGAATTTPRAEPQRSPPDVAVTAVPAPRTMAPTAGPAGAPVAAAAPAAPPAATPSPQALIEVEPPAAGRPGTAPAAPPRPAAAVAPAEAGGAAPAESTVRPATPAAPKPKAPAAVEPPRATVEARRPAEPEPVSPRAACSPRTNFALYRCMQAQCERDVFYVHPQCIRLRQRDEVS